MVGQSSSAPAHTQGQGRDPANAITAEQDPTLGGDPGRSDRPTSITRTQPQWDFGGSRDDPPGSTVCWVQLFNDLSPGNPLCWAHPRHPSKLGSTFEFSTYSATAAPRLWRGAVLLRIGLLFLIRPQPHPLWVSVGSEDRIQRQEQVFPGLSA